MFLSPSLVYAEGDRWFCFFALTVLAGSRVKGVGSEQTIESQILIHTVGEGEQMRIKKVEDKWDGEIKQGGLKNALRELNSKSVPLAVSVPKSVEEEESGQ